MSEATMARTGVTGKPLPRTQQVMAGLILAGKVSYNPDRALWYLDPDADAEQGVVRGSDGRALRAMRTSAVLTVLDGQRDGRGAYPVELTELGHARHRPAGHAG